MSRHEFVSARLPHNIDPWPLAEIKPSSDGNPTYGETSHNPWPKGYRSLDQVLGPIEEVPFQGNPGPNDNPIVSHLGPITRPSIPVMVGGKSINQVMSSNSNAGGKPPARVTSSVSGIIASSGKVSAVAQPLVVIPPIHTNVVLPPSILGQSLGVQPVNNLASRVL